MTHGNVKLEGHNVTVNKLELDHAIHKLGRQNNATLLRVEELWQQINECTFHFLSILDYFFIDAKTYI